MKITKLSVCVSMVGLLATLPAAYANEIITNCTQVTATGEGDLDSTPNNMVGETVVEDDESCAKVMIPFDYGDAPDPAYQTLDASGGARHQLGTDVFLGQCVDGDSGLLQGGATADDADAGSPVYGTCATASDEDGVTFGELRVGETGATVEVIASKDCKLNAWVDWNVDGNWGGTAEQVFLNQQLTAGINSLTLNVPASAVLGDTYARFRCSTVGNDGIGGEAADGEVEDYKVSILEAIPVTPVSVGDTIWIDANENGVQDLGESPLEGATVTLLDKDGNPVKDLDGNDVTAATTGTDGKYLFSNLPEGDYIVRVAPPSGYQVTSGGADVDGNPANDDNNCAVVGNNVETAPFNLAAGMEPVNDGDTDANTNLSVDCGFFQPPAPTHSIGNLVWVDDGNGNGSVADNGLFEDGETRISGIQMELRDKDGNPLSSTLTAGGYYLFSGLAAGEYQVCVAASNFTAGGQLEGYGASTVANEIDANLNVDNNDNGDDIVANGLCSNVVILDDQEPTGETPTASGTAGDDGQGTEDARSNLTVDFALTPPVAATPVSVGDTIWIDTNNDGLQDAGESPLAGATVTLLDAGGNPVKDLDGNDVTAATTGTDGKYLFDNLPEGDYIVRVTPPSGYQATSGGADVDDSPANNDSNCAVVGSNIQTLPFTLTAGMEPDVGADGDGTNSNLTVDCGFYQPPEPTHSIGNRVWVDTNNNGLADVGENPAVAGITLELKGSDGSAIASTQTDAAGRYLFSGLAADSYQVCVAASNFATGALLEGYTASTGGNVVDANTDIDGDDNGTDDTSVGLCSNLVVLDDQEPLDEATATGNDGDDGVGTEDNRSNLTVDFGIVPPELPPKTVSVGNYIWEDANQNGQQDLDEKGLANMPVLLLDKDGNPAKDINGNEVAVAWTDADGKYLFSNLPEGEYIIQVNSNMYQPTIGGADVDENTSDTDNNCLIVGEGVGENRTLPFTLTAGSEPNVETDGDGADSNLTVDCGFYMPQIDMQSIGNMVWIDDGAGDAAKANNGVKDVDENVVPDGVLLELRDNSGTLMTTTTTVNGYYLFSFSTYGRTNEFQVCVAASNFNEGSVLAGYTASTGGDEIDANDDVDNNDNGDNTAIDGVCSNIIVLDDKEPTGETPTASGIAGDDGMGTDDNRSNLTVDFALIPPAVVTPVSVGDYIWVDTNNDGLQDAGESPLAGATVTLLDKDGNPVKDLDGNDVTAATTGTDGKYLFDNLPEGDYIVRVTPPSGYQATSGGADADDNLANNDSNCAVVGSNIQTLPFTLTAGMEPDVGADGDGTNSNLTVDCGFYQPPEPTHSIGNRVWVDTNNNGLADVGENPAVAGITLELKGSDGSAIASTQTDADGRYLFSGLGAGSYQVCVATSNFATGALLEGYTASTGGNVTDANTDIDGDDNGTDDTSVGLCTNLVVLDDQEPLDEVTATGSDGDDGVGTDDNRSNLTVDFGIVPPAPVTPVSVGDYIWVDANENGLQDEGDGLLAGATVTLLDKDGDPVKDLDGNTVTAATTGTDGKYLFSNLPEGDYIVRVVPPAGYQVTTGGADVDDNPANDDNNCAVVGSNIQTLPFTLTASMEPDVAADGDGTNSNLTVDCGFYQPPAPTHSIGNMVWVDNGAGNAANANNGIRDAGEAAVKDGVVMELLDKDGIVIREVQTSDGYYLFSGLEAGDYRVCVAHGNFDLGLLAGYTASSGGDEADVNSNGDNNDNGDNDTQNGLCSNVITLNDQEPTGETPTASGIAGDDGQGTEDARSNLTVDFGVIPPVIPVSVGDSIWIDANKDGVKDASETALSGATVTLLDKNGNLAKDLDGNNVTAVTTGTDGKYLFSNLPEGDYIVRVTPPSGYQVTTGGADVDDNPANNDNNCAVVGNNVQTAPFTLTGGMEPDVAADGDGKDSNLTVDCGFFQPPAPTHSIGNMVWVDNGNGQFDDGEVRPSGVKVELHDKDGNLLSSTLTAGGYYLFSGLDAGSYQVCVAASNFDAGGVLAGHTPSTVSDETDANSDGDGNDNGDNTIADGLCSNLVVLDDKEPKGEFPTAIGTAGDDGQGTDDALSNLTVDFAVLAPAPLAVGNRIWLDSNGNGIQDADEPGLTGATVTLKDSAGNAVVDIDGNNVAPQTTGADGLYRFDKLLEGEYVVSITAPAGYTPTTGGLDVDSDASDKDSNCRINSVSGAFDTLPFNLKAGTEPDTSADGDDTNGNMTVDCGMVRPLKLGSRIWLDLDGDGSQDEGEPGIAGATVTLLTADGNPVTDIFGNPVQPMVTDADGNYAFGNLREGSYVLKVTPPTGYVATVLTSNPNNDDGTDSNGIQEGEYLITNPITLEAGAEPDEGGYANLTVGFGLVPRVTDEIPPMQVPTLSQWGMAILSMLLAAVGFSRRRRDDQG